MARSRVLAMAVAGLLLAGCGGSSGSPTSAPPTTAPPSPTPVATTSAPRASAALSTDEGPSASGADALTMTLPSNWSVVNMDLAAIQGMLSANGSRNPQLSAVLNQLITSGAYKQLNFFAFEYDGLTLIGNVDTEFGLPTNGMNLDAIAPLMEGEIEQAGFTNVTTRHVTLPLGDVLLVSYDISFTAGTGKFPESGRAYYYEANGELYSATFTCGNPSATTCLADSDSIAETLTLTP